MAQPSGAQRVPVVEAEAPAAPPRGKLVLRRQQTQEGGKGDEPAGVGEMERYLREWSDQLS